MAWRRPSAFYGVSVKYFDRTESPRLANHGLAWAASVGLSTE